jgi:hypothetical protein
MSITSFLNLPDFDFLTAAKMSFSRFCRRSLAALPVFLVFLSCDQLLPPAGSGEWVQVKIRAVNIAGGAQNKTNTRAGGGEQKGIEGEPVIQDLGGGMLAEITVEEDVSALRVDPGPLAKDVKLRIVALIKNSSTIYSWADYTATSSGAFSKVAGNLHVVSGVEYDFVCFSYNSATASLPDPLNEGGILGSITVTNANDFLYEKLTEQKLDAIDNTLSFTLKQQLVKVKLKLDVNTNASRTITNITANSFSMNAPASGSFNLASGILGAGSDITKYFGWPSTLGSATAESEEFTFLPKASGEHTLSWAENAVTALENSTIQRSFGGLGSITVPCSQFKAGYSYSIGLKLYRLPRFAGSNIYWDDDNDQLTFAPHGDNTRAKYQGVYFQWGSLIGISPVGDYDSNSTVLYKPTNTGADNTAPRTWEKTTGSTWGADWDAIPSYDGESSINTSLDATSLLDKPAFGSYKGDICYYINEDYRMPTMSELDSLRSSSPYVGFTNDPSDIPSSGDDDVAGRHVFTANYGTFTSHVLPASGIRYSATGALYDVGDGGYYWSGSGLASDGEAYRLYFSGSDAYTFYIGGRTFGRPVRCVLQK